MTKEKKFTRTWRFRLCVLTLIVISLFLSFNYKESRFYHSIEVLYKPTIEMLEAYKKDHGQYPQNLQALGQEIPKCTGAMPIELTYDFRDNGNNYCIRCPAEMGDEYRYCSEDKRWGVF